MLICAAHCARAQMPDWTNLVLVTEVPASGSFFSMQLNPSPPWPTDPYPDLPLYTSEETPGQYWYDDMSIDYGSLGHRHRHGGTSGGVIISSPDDAPAPPGGGTNYSGGTNYPPTYTPFVPPGPGYTNCVTWTNFWLHLEASSTGTEVMGEISNTLPELDYILLCATNLAEPTWTPIQTLTATSFITPFTVTSGGSNLFFRAVLSNNALAPMIISAPSNQVVYSNGSATFTVTAEGHPAVSYQWLFDGTSIAGATTSSYTVASAQATNAGIYTVLVSNAICEASASAGLGLIWTAFLTNAINASPAISPDGKRIFIQTTASQFFALDAASGGIIWLATLPNDGNSADITSSAVVASDGTAVYVGCEGGYLMAFTPTNGDVKWSSYLGGYIAASPALSADNSALYVGTYNSSSNGLYAVSAANGSTLWFFETDNPVFGAGDGVDSSASVAADCSILFLAQTWDEFCLNSDGSLRWFFPLPSGSSPDGSPALSGNGTSYLGSSGSYGHAYVYAVNSAGGMEWAFDSGGTAKIQASVALAADLTTYAASDGGVIWAITNGSSKWELALTNAYGDALSCQSSPAISQDNVLYIGAADNDSLAYGLYAITNGAVKSWFPTAANVISSPVINPADGGIIVADMSGYVYKLPGSQSADPSAAWPMFRQNAQHSSATPNPSCSGGGVQTVFPNNPSINSGSGTFSFYLSGTLGSTWGIITSSNLSDWSNLTVVNLDANYGYTSFQDTNVAGLTNRFYEMEYENGCSQIMGFIILTIPPGTNLIANPFYQINDYEYPQNTANGLLSFMNLSSGYSYPFFPDQSEILQWNGTEFEANTYLSVTGTWDPNGNDTMIPGQAFFFVNPTTNAFTVPFAGLLAPGMVTNVIPPGTNFVSSIIPWAGLLHSNLMYAPNDGDTVGLWTGSGYAYHTYSASSQTWSNGEPSLSVGEGFLLVNSTTNFWVQSVSGCQPGLILVTADPVWTDTHTTVTNGATIIFPATGTWTGCCGYYGPAGNGTNSTDTFVTGSQFALIAFVGPDPYDSGATDEWGTTYFPQPSGSNGYWFIGSSNQFTTDRSGELWYGFNDDGRTEETNDNFGFVTGYITITNGP